ncbi:MAG: TetR/AcrR family transcriptional regulator [Rhodospirillales bacterium]|nr:TetR/AcrR family transcriptional regulator [Rhodospirillales bacterium]
MLLEGKANILAVMTISHLKALVKAPRRRRPPVEMRAHVIQAARELLQAEGPQAITLKAVAVRAGVTHGNVTYHFGTVDALHSALITSVIEDITSATTAAVAHLRQGEMSTRDVVDVVFEAFDVGGAGRLAAWLAATGADDRLAPLYAIIADLVGELAKGDAGRQAGGTSAIGLMMATVVFSALGESLIGTGLEAALGLERGSARQFTADGLTKLRESRAEVMSQAGYPHRFTQL